jgi:hypothetical protein
MDEEDMEEEMDSQISQILDEVAGDALAALPQPQVCNWRDLVLPSAYTILA